MASTTASLPASRLRSALTGFIVRLRTGGFFASAAKLATGAAIAQILGVAAAPLLSRIYGAVNLGLYAAFMSVVGAVTPLICLRYDQAIMLPEDQRDSDRLWTLTGGLIVFLSMLSAGVLALGHNYGWLGELSALGAWLWLLPVACGTTALAAAAGVMANRRRCYNLISMGRCGSAFTAAILSVTLGWLAGASTGWLILGNLIGQAVLLAVFWTSLRRRGFTPSTVTGIPDLKALAWRYRQFPFFNLPMTAVDQITGALPILVFTSTFGAGSAGILNIAFQALRLPAAFIGGAVAQVFYERASRISHDPAALRTMTLKTCAVLSAMALIPVVVLFPLGPFLFGSVFGSSFAASGELARLLAVSAGLNLIVSPISMLPSIMGRQHQHFWFAILSAVFRILSLWIGVRLGSPATTVACFVAGECAGMVIFSVWVYWLIRIPRFSSPS